MEFGADHRWNKERRGKAAGVREPQQRNGPDYWNLERGKQPRPVPAAALLWELPQASCADRNK